MGFFTSGRSRPSHAPQRPPALKASVQVVEETAPKSPPRPRITPEERAKAKKIQQNAKLRRAKNMRARRRKRKNKTR